MAGYSGTPLPQKLGIKENSHVMLVEMPAEVRVELRQSLAKCKVVRDGPLDFAMVFVKSQAELKQQFSKIAKLLAPAGMVWVSWPKKSSGLATDISENGVRRIGLNAGLVDVKVCAVNEVWSGLKFVIRIKDRRRILIFLGYAGGNLLRVGLIGFGLGGQAFHAPMIQGTPGLELTCIVARSGDLAQRRYPNTRVVRTVDEMLADEQIRLCVVTTPNTSHFDLTQKCLLARRDVIVDKPFTPTLREAEELVALAVKLKRLLTVYQDRRWDGDFQTIKKIIAAGTLGEITEYESRYDRFRPQLKGHWRERAEPGAGILFDLGPHLLDQALVLFGTPQAVSARLLYQRGIVVDDGFDVALEYPKFRALLRARMMAFAPTHHFLIHGRNGSFVKYGMDPQEDFLRRPNPPSGTDWGAHWGEDREANWGTLSLAESGARKIKTEIGDYRNYYANVRDVILGKAQLDVTPQQALNTMRVLELAQKSDRERRSVGWDEKIE